MTEAGPSDAPRHESTRARPAIPGRSAFRFWTREKLRNADTDQFGHVNNAPMATFLESARMEIIAVPQARAALDGLTLAVVHLSIDFHHELFFPGSVDVGSTVVSVGRHSFSVSQGIFDEARCVASAQATCVLFDRAKGTSAPVPDALRAYLVQAPGS